MSGAAPMGQAVAGAAPAAQAARSVTLVLPLPPPANKRLAPVRTRTGATLVVRRPTERWSDAARWMVASQRGGVCLPYRFHALIVLPDTGADIDARIKDLLDACEHGGAIANDKHCRRLLIEIDESRPDTALIELTATNDIPPPARARRSKGPARIRNIHDTHSTKGTPT